MALFMFLAVGAVALFTASSVEAWVNARKEERKTNERYALLRKLSEQPTESARLVMEFVREEEERERKTQRVETRQSRKDALGWASIMLAAGVGLAIMLAAVSPEKPVWTLGLIPILVGAVMFVFAYFDTPQKAEGTNGRG